MRAIARRRRTCSPDTGMSLLEVVIAMAIFSIGVTAILKIFISTGGVAGDNIRRTTAASLVDKTLEAARAQAAVAITNGRVVTTQPVGGITYTITQDASFLSSDSTSSLCQSTGTTLAYKLVRVAVTWPGMGQVQPVTGDLLRTVGLGADGVSTSSGTLAVLVTGATGLPVAGVSVALSGTGTTQQTGSDGCAVFAGVTATAYTVTANQTGYVGTANSSTASTTLSAAAGSITRATLLYDTERTLQFVFDTPVAAVLPSGLPIRIGNSYLPEYTLATCGSSSSQACLTATPGSVLHLFPVTQTLKAGSCAESDASAASVDLRPVTANNSIVSLPMGAVTVSVKNVLGAFVGGRKITMTYSGSSSCGATDVFTTQSVAGGSTVMLPYGTWTFSTVSSSGLPLAGTVQVTVNSTGRTATVSLTAAS